jgi:HlyD family secretion protein
VQITAPVNVPQLRIVWLAPAGDPVKAGDPIIRFDPSSAKQQLQEREAALKQAEATLDQAVAQARIMAEQDKRDLASARYEVERAKLETSKVEIVSRLQGEESKIDLATAQQKLTVQDATVKLHEASNTAKIASLTRQREQAESEVKLTQQRLAAMELKAPLSGIVVYLSNYSQGWMNAKPFKVGDQAWPGGAIAEIPDLSTLEMSGKVEEIDRGRIQSGFDVNVRVDALPEITLPAKLDLISPLTEQSFEWPPTRSFKGYAQLKKGDPRLRPGMNGSMDVVVSRIPGAISIPAKAVFTHQGKPVVYASEKGGYRTVEVKVDARNPDEVAITGIPAGTLVAMVDVLKKERK